MIDWFNAVYHSAIALAATILAVIIIRDRRRWKREDEEWEKNTKTN